MMTEVIKCKKCNAVMKPVKEGHTPGMICPDCGYGWVTSYFEPIDEDQTFYELSISRFSSVPSTDKLKAIGKVITDKNILQIRKEIVTAALTVKDKAGKIAEYARFLSENNIHFTIT